MHRIGKARPGEVASLSAGHSLNVWRYSDPHIEDWPGQARPHPDTVDYRFINGFVATGDLPCREALRAVLPQRIISLSDCPPLPHIHAGADGPRVDFSTFCFTPKLIGRWARCTLSAQKPCQLPVRIETCGALHLWVGEDKITAFEPYDRNTPRHLDIGLPLSEGPNVLTVYFDDLHERDTSCFFQLTTLERATVSRTDPERVSTGGNDVAGILANLRTDRIFHRAEAIAIVTDHPVVAPLTLALVSDDPSQTSANLPDETASATLTQAGKRETLITTERLIPGGVLLPLVATIGGQSYARTIGTTVLPEPDLLSDPDLATRKQTALTLICARGQSTPSRALALFARGQGAEAEALLGPALIAVQNRHDCADFFLLPLLRIWRDHGAELSAPLRDRLRNAILGFRYWMDEPGNDVMWFWSENHAMCFHACQYLAGDLFSDDDFTASGRQVAEQRARGHARLRRWFAAIAEHGLGEWNSAAYYPIDLIGLLTLFDMAPDADIRREASALCDQIFRMTALHTCGGVPTGSQGRCYEKEIFAGPATELGAVAAIAFGGPWHWGHERAAALLAISTYAPPDNLTALHHPPQDRALTARYVQGLDANARLCVWKTAHVQLSSVADHMTGAIGHQQHVVDLQMAAHPLARLWVNHPGDLKVWGGARPSLWAGSGVLPKVAQHGDQVALILNLAAQDHPITLTHAFIPRDIMEDVVSMGQWIFARCGAGFAGIWASEAPICVTDGLYAGSEWRVPGPRCAWIMIAGDAQGHGDFARFQRQCTSRAPVFDATRLALQCGPQDIRFDAAPEPDFPTTLIPQIDWTNLTDDRPKP